jgi:hypothetical protein
MGRSTPMSMSGRCAPVLSSRSTTVTRDPIIWLAATNAAIKC